LRYGLSYRDVEELLAERGIEVDHATVYRWVPRFTPAVGRRRPDPPPLAGVDPAPDRAATTWSQFLRSQAEVLLAADFIETITLTGTRVYVLAVVEHASRRIRILGATAHPSAAWVTQAARNLVMDLEDADCRVKYLIRDRDGNYPALFDTIPPTPASRSCSAASRYPA
jgi:hypothetical protein